jgi:hypothetical protein
MLWRTRVRRFAFGLVGLFYCACAVSASDSGGNCVGIDDDRARLTCYDAAFGRKSPTASTMPAAPAAGVVAGAAVASAPAATTAVPTGSPAPVASGPAQAGQAEQSFGLSAKQLDVEKGPESVNAKVVSVEAAPYIGRWIVTLDNGQVWEQRETTPQARRPHPGDEVTISAAVFGSFLLKSSRGSSRVRRIR